VHGEAEASSETREASCTSAHHADPGLLLLEEKLTLYRASWLALAAAGLS